MINHKSYKTKWSLFPRGIVLLYSLWIHGSVRSCFWIKSILSVTFFSEWHCVYILSSSVKRWTRSTESQIECHQTERYLDQNIGLNKIMIQWRHQYFIYSSYTDKFNIFSAIIKFIFFLNFFFFLNMKKLMIFREPGGVGAAALTVWNGEAVHSPQERHTTHHDNACQRPSKSHQSSHLTSFTGWYLHWVSLCILRKIQSGLFTNIDQTVIYMV